LDPPRVDHPGDCDRADAAADSCRLAAPAGLDPAADKSAHRASDEQGDGDAYRDAHTHTGSVHHSAINPCSYGDTKPEATIYADLDSDANPIPYAYQNHDRYSQCHTYLDQLPHPFAKPDGHDD
jgi:hypothetical protein